ncbi:MAG: hypothetical protein ABJA78_05615 [Ferruginibacter sp.]
MNKIIALSGFIFLSIIAVAQEKKLPAEAATFVPRGFEMLDYIKGDLNADGKPDAILILKQQAEDTSTADDLLRPLLILIRQANGKLKQEKKSDHIMLCKTCGGMMGDPYQETIIKANGFSISFFGGSSWRWGVEYSFVYKPAKKNWFLKKQQEESFQEGDPEATTKKITIAEEELGEVSIDQLNSSPEPDDVKWRVTAAKTFFYDSPKLGSKTRKGYLLKGNEAGGIRELKNFVEVSFENSNGQFTTGFVLKKDIEKIK